MAIILRPRDDQNSFFGGSERIGMILLVVVAFFSVTALAAILVIQRRRPQLMHIEIAPSEALQHTPKGFGILTEKPAMHDIYVSHASDVYFTPGVSWQDSTVSAVSVRELARKVVTLSCTADISYAGLDYGLSGFATREASEDSDS